MKYKNNFIITIPSYKRADMLLSKENPLDYIDKDLMEHTRLILRYNELRNYSNVLVKYDCDYAVVESNINGIPETRNEIVEYGRLLNKEYLIMIDDDTKFAKRPNYSNVYERLSVNNFSSMIDELLSICGERYPIVGIQNRQFSNTKTSVFSVNTRIGQLFCLHLPTLKKENVNFNDLDIPIMEDYYLVLKMLSLGYKNTVLNYYVRDDPIWKKGGCFVDRTVNDFKIAISKLLKLFGKQIIKPYWKKDKMFKEEHLNIKVAWKKAFNKKLYDARYERKEF